MSEIGDAPSPSTNDEDMETVTVDNVDEMEMVAVDMTIAVQPDEGEDSPKSVTSTEEANTSPVTNGEDSPITENVDEPDQAITEEPNVTPFVEIPTESTTSVEYPSKAIVDTVDVTEETFVEDLVKNVDAVNIEDPPSEAPTEVPTEAPTEVLTEAPSEVPSEFPSETPTEAPSEAPTEVLTEAPSQVPSEAPTEPPTEVPSEAPTEAPSEVVVAEENIPVAVVESPSPATTDEGYSLKNGPLKMLKKTASAFIDPQLASPSTNEGGPDDRRNTYDLSALKKPSSRAAEAVKAANDANKKPPAADPVGAVSKLKQVNATLQVKEDGTVISISNQEKQAFAEHINICLEGDKAVKYMLPIDPESDDLFVKFSNGLLLCKLVNCAKIDSIDERAMNLDPNMNNYKKAENQNLALNAARSIGCQVINVGAADLLQGTPSLVLGLLWQVIRIQLLGLISLKNVPELVLLLQEGETMTAFLALNPEIILLRWLNFHLKRAKSGRVVKNFTKDLLDSEVYGAVLQQLSPELCDRITEKDPMARATHAIKNAKAMGVNVFIKPEHVCSGVKSLNTSFVAQIFNTCHGLNLPVHVPETTDMNEKADSNLSLSRESIEDEIRAALDVDDAGNASDSREVRVFSMWINSLNVSDLYIQHLFLDISGNGISLLHVIDRVEPGSVNWKRVNKAANLNKFKKIENANYVIELGKQMKFSLVNVGGTDIADCNKKLILAFVWQLMRLYTLNVLADLARRTGLVTGGSGVTEAQIIKWANKKVEESNGTGRMKSFRDSSVKDSFFLLELVAAIRSNAVSWDNVKRPTPVEGSEELLQLNEEDLLSNAKYVISCARKIGAMVFLTPEDIVEVKSKMLLTLVASLWATELDPVQI